MSPTLIFSLFVLFQIKHFLADFPLQTKYMLGKSKANGWILPLLLHSLVHGVFTLIISLHFVRWAYAWRLALMDIIIHGFIDTIKARPDLLGRWSPDSKYFWWFLGADQLLHGLFGTWIVWVIVTSSQ